LTKYNKKDTYKLFAVTIEERDLWIEAIHVYMGVKVFPTLCGGVQKEGRDVTELFKVKRMYIDLTNATKSGYKLV
jgi:hypothetical protein